MLGYLTRNLRNRKGFTLIELLVVIVIIGILSGAAIMTIGGSNTEKANLARAKSDVSTIVSALEMYKLDTGKYPTTAQKLDILVANDATTPVAKWAGPYLKSVPADPYAATAGSPYTYTSADGTSYSVTAAGPGTDSSKYISDINLK